MHDMDLENIFKYHSPKNDQPERYQKIRESAKAFAHTIMDCCPDCEDRDAAIMKVRMAVMTANASIAINESTTTG